MTDGAYYEHLIEILEQPYLNATDVRGQSGFRGDAARWERARRVITAPMVRDGSLLDVGCANGLLMEAVAEWTAAEGLSIEPYGLDLSPKLAEFARSRLPDWADRIWSGNVMTWVPPRRFNYVRTELEYAPTGLRPALVQRLLDLFLEPGGTAILCSYGSARRPSPAVYEIGETVRAMGFDVAGEAEAEDTNGVVFTKIAWLRKAP